MNQKKNNFRINSLFINEDKKKKSLIFFLNKSLYFGYNKICLL